MRAVPVAVHPSEAPLTVPEAPELATIGRSQARQLFEEQLALKEEKLQARDQNSACSCWHLCMHWPSVVEHLAMMRRSYRQTATPGLQASPVLWQLYEGHSPELVADGGWCLGWWVLPLECACAYCHLRADPAHYWHAEAAP